MKRHITILESFNIHTCKSFAKSTILSMIRNFDDFISPDKVAEISKVAANIYYSAIEEWQKSHRSNYYSVRLFSILIEHIIEHIKKTYINLMEIKYKNKSFDNLLTTKKKYLKEAIDVSKKKIATYPEQMNKLIDQIDELEKLKGEKLHMLAISKSNLKLAEQNLLNFKNYRDEMLGKDSVETAKKNLAKAQQILQNIRKEDVEELKSYISPPVAVMQLSEALCIMFNFKPRWSEAKKLLASKNVMLQLIYFKVEGLNEKKLVKIGKYLQLPALQMEHLGNVSIATKGICAWLRAIFDYAVQLNIARPEK